MKTLPGLKIVAFAALVLIVAVAVYARTRQEPAASSGRPMFIVKFGWDDQADPGPLDISLKTIQAVLRHFKIPEERYVVHHYVDGHRVDADTIGKLNVCSEPTPTPAPVTGPTATPTPTSGGPMPGGTPKGGAKTQNAAAVALGTISDAHEFLARLSADAASEKPAKKKKK
jgi:hypothetical protein